MNAALADNPASSCPDWIYGNIIFDRDIYASGAPDYGISLCDGAVLFGTGTAFGSSDSEHVLFGDQDVANATWHHIALTRARTSGLKCLYVDGALDVPCENGTTDDISYPNGYTGISEDNPFLVLGAEKHDAGPAYPSFNGTIDEVRIWNVARTQAQIAASMNASLSGGEAGLVLYWRLDDGSGNVAIDASGDGNHGDVRTGSAGAAEWVASTAPIGGPGVGGISSLPHIRAPGGPSRPILVVLVSVSSAAAAGAAWRLRRGRLRRP